MEQEQLLAYETVDALLDSAKFPEAIEKMRPWNKSWLHQFYETYPHRYRILQHTDFNDFWAERRAGLNSKVAFVAQKNISDIDFVLGYVFYLLVLKNEASHSKAHFTKYLKLALEFHSIHAAQTIFHEMIIKTDSDKTKQMEEIAELLLNWKNLASEHGTPGFLLLANGYLHLAKIAAEQKDYTRYEAACACLWENLTLAELEEPQSAASIHNAYFGKGLELSNPLQIETIKTLKEKASILITDNSIKTRAENQVKASSSDKEEQAHLLTWLQSRNRSKAAKPAPTTESTPPSPKI